MTEDYEHGTFEKFYVTVVILFVILLGGGTTQFLWSDHLIQLLLLPLIFMGLARVRLASFDIISWFILCSIMGFIALQFVPYGQIVDLPNTQEKAYQAFWTASPSRALESALFAITCLGLFFYVATTRFTFKVSILWVVLFAVLIHGIVGIIQLSYSSRFELLGLLPFSIRSGLFANENHFSTLLFASIPVLGFLYLSLQRNIGLFIGLSVLIAALLFAIGSRAGMVFAVLQLCITMLWFYSRNLSYLYKVLLYLPIVMLILFCIFTFDLSVELEDGLRSELFANTWRAISDNLLFGTGFGSFVVVYPLYETASQIERNFINHAHNDLLELTLEFGLSILLPITLYILVICHKLLIDRKAGVLAITIIAILVHTLVDYPLRTYSVATLFVIVSAVLLSSSTKVSISSKLERANEL